MRLALGTLLRDKYQIVRKLADGEEGEVFEARHVDLAGRYAVKFLCEGGIRNALLLDELRREALATSVLTHPGIVRVSDLDQAPDGSPFLVTEFLNGQDLGRVVRRAVPMALADVAALVEAIASPLAEAHGRGIVHGDLTPENVFVLDVEADTAARVKILDFGVAKIRARAGGLVRGAGAAGASAYAPPERQRGRDWEVDARADVFSLGAIAHALISGRAPTRVTAAGPAASGVKAPALPVLPAVATVLERAMRNDREARFQSVTDFAQALRAAVVASRARRSSVRVARLGPTPAVPLATLQPPPVRGLGSVKRTVAAAVGCGLAILIGTRLFIKPTRKPVEAAKISSAPSAASARPVAKPLPPTIAPPRPAPPALPSAESASDRARQPLPPHDEVAHHHHHRSAHAGMAEADRREMAQSYQKATRAFDVQKYDEAITAYKKAYELGGDAPMLYNIAQALRLSNRPDEALVYYRRYLDRAPTAPNRQEVRARIAELTGKSEGPSPVKPASASPADASSRAPKAVVKE